MPFSDLNSYRLSKIGQGKILSGFSPGIFACPVFKRLVKNFSKKRDIKNIKGIDLVVQK